MNGLQEMINSATRAVDRIGKLTSGLEGMVAPTAPEDDYAIVRVTFAHAAAHLTTSWTSSTGAKLGFKSLMASRWPTGRAEAFA